MGLIREGPPKTFFFLFFSFFLSSFLNGVLLSLPRFELIAGLEEKKKKEKTLEGTFRTGAHGI